MQLPSAAREGLTVRAATLADADAIGAIYAHHVLHGSATFEAVPPDIAELRTRMARILDRGWPWLVAEANKTILGYAYAGQLNPRSGYRFSCENSIYLHPDQTGRGIGTALLGRLIEACAEAGFVRMFAVIGDSPNAASIALHSGHGFTHAGTLQSAGYNSGDGSTSFTCNER